jgi:ferredoxin
MALLITSACINCDMCVAECPNQAIEEGPKIYSIDVDRCSECVGYYPQPTCIQVCPINCIVVHPEHQETQQQLLQKAQKILAHQMSPDLKQRQ